MGYQCFKKASKAKKIITKERIIRKKSREGVKKNELSREGRKGRRKMKSKVESSASRGLVERVKKLTPRKGISDEN